MSDMTITVDSDEYVLRPDGDGLQVGRRVGGDVAWLDTVDLGLLPASRARGAGAGRHLGRGAADRRPRDHAGRGGARGLKAAPPSGEKAGFAAWCA